MANMAIKPEKSKTLLLVEDEALIAAAEKMELEERGYRVIHVCRGEDAVLSALDPAVEIDLILMDINLGSGIDGTETARRILAEKDIPVVFLSSHTSPEVVEKTEKITSYGYVVKHSGIVVLDASIKMAFKLFEAKKEEERKEQSLLDIKENLADIFNTANDGIVYISMDGIIIAANRQLERIIGISERELKDRSIIDICSGLLKKEQVDRLRPIVLRLLNGKDIDSFEIEYNGKTIEISVSINNSTHRITSIVRDITESKQAKIQIEEREAKYRSLFYHAPTGIISVAPDGTILEVNAAMLDILGSPSAEATKEINFLEFPPLIEAGVAGHAKQCLETGEPQKCEHSYTSKWGKKTFLHYHLSPVRSSSGSIIAVQANVIDDTERIQAKETLRQSEERYRNFISQISEGVYRFEIDKPMPLSMPVEEQVDYLYEHSRIAEFNPAFMDMYSIKNPEDILGKSQKDLHGGSDNPANRKATLKFIENGYRTENAVTEEPDSLGRKKYFANTSLGIIEDQRLVRVWGTQRDITDLFQTRQALQEQEELARKILLTVPDIIVQTDIDGVITFVNDAVHSVFTDLSKDEIVGRNMMSFIVEKDRSRAAANTRLMFEKPLGIVEYQLQLPDGTLLDCAVNGDVLNDIDKKPFGMVYVLRDITQRKKAEQDLLDSEERFRKLSDLTFEGILIHTNGIVDDMNESLARITGYTREELIGENIITLCVLPEYHALIQANIEKHSVDPYRIKARRKNGTVFSAEIQSRNIAGSDATRVTAVRDITDRKETEQRLSNIIDGIRAGTWEWNVQTGETVFNERWAGIIGYTLEDISPVSEKTWKNFSHPADLEISKGLLEQHFRGETDYYECETRMKHKDGHWVWVSDRGKVIQWTEEGKPLVMYGTHQDITARKQQEIKRAEQTRIQEELTGFFSAAQDQTLPDLYKNICCSMRDIFGLKHVWISSYDAGRSALVLEHTTASEKENSFISNTISKALAGRKKAVFNMIPVNRKTYDRIVSERISEPSSLYDISFKKLPAPVCALIEKTLGIGWVQGLALVFGGKLFGTMVFVGHQGQACPDQLSVANAVTIITPLIKRKQTEQELIESEARYRAIFDNSPYGILLSDWRKITDANRAFYRLTGFSEKDILGCKITQLPTLPGKKLPVYLDLIKQARRGRQIKNFEFEWINAAGETRLGLAQIAPIGKMNIKNGFQAILEDITEKKIAEYTAEQQLREKEILLREVHHRIKNNIAMISSLLSLQARSAGHPDVKAGLHKALGRVDSIRVIYDRLLMTEDYSELSVKNYLDELCAAVAVLFPEQAKIVMNTAIDDFSLDTKRLFLVGLIVNELVTNAIKYGFAGRAQGTVDITLANTEGIITLRVQDNGRGLPRHFSINRSAGFGLKLVSMLTEQLEGTLSIERRNGTAFIINFNL